jgi:hypothetical protein
MRRIILAGLVLVAAASAFEVPSVQAQVSSSRNPWCIRDGVAGRGSWDCSYYNSAQCLASASGAGGWCTENPNYRGGKSKKSQWDKRDGGNAGWGRW